MNNRLDRDATGTFLRKCTDEELDKFMKGIRSDPPCTDELRWLGGLLIEIGEEQKAHADELFLFAKLKQRENIGLRVVSADSEPDAER